MSEAQDDRLFGIPRIIVPLGNIDGGGGEQALPQRTFGEEPEIISNPEQSGNIPYVMRSTLLGSDDPTNPAAALGLGVANTDTWKREDPPQKQTVAISNASVATATVLTTAAHGIAAGITTTVKIAGVSTTTPPIPDAFYQATYVSATSVSIPFTVTVGGIVTGTMAILTSGVTINEWTRFFIEGSGGGTFTQKVFTRQEKKDAYGKTYYISAETLAEIDTESGSGSAGGGL
jgi:hypothetical protein